ncbi:MAG TPA: hypothetical protein VGI21_18065 [Streptosporangiaceae bacterium]
MTGPAASPVVIPGGYPVARYRNGALALPTIQHEFGMAPADLQWIVTGYALTSGSAPPRR